MWSQRRAILVGQQDRLAVGCRPARAAAMPAAPSTPRAPGPRARAASAQPGSRPRRRASPQQRRSGPLLAGGRRVALVEDEIDHLEHRREPVGAARRGQGTSKGTLASVSVRLARTIRWATVPSETRNARAISGVDRPPSRRSVSATRASRREHRMAGHEDQPEDVVGHLVDLRREVGTVELLEGLQLAPDQLRACARASRDAVVRRSPRRLAVAISQAPGLSGMPCPRPLLERGHQRVLRQVLGHCHVADDPGQPGDQPGRLDPPDGVDRAMGGRLATTSWNGLRSARAAVPRTRAAPG